MKGTYLGEFEEIVLLALCVLEDAYGVSITEEINRSINRSVHISAVHTALYRLENKGFISSYLGGATNERGGRRKRLYRITTIGKNKIREAHDIRNQFWNRISSISLEGGKI